jgi:hypothetical protein
MKDFIRWGLIDEDVSSFVPSCILCPMLQLRRVLARQQPDRYCKIPKCQNVGDPEVGDPKLATRKDTKIGEIGDIRRWESAVDASPLSYSSVAHFLPLASREKAEFCVGCFCPSKFSILLTSFPSCGTATNEGRNSGANRLERPSAAEPQLYSTRAPPLPRPIARPVAQTLRAPKPNLLRHFDNLLNRTAGAGTTSWC